MMQRASAINDIFTSMRVILKQTTSITRYRGIARKPRISARAVEYTTISKTNKARQSEVEVEEEEVETEDGDEEI